MIRIITSYDVFRIICILLSCKGRRHIIIENRNIALNEIRDNCCAKRLVPGQGVLTKLQLVDYIINGLLINKKDSMYLTNREELEPLKIINNDCTRAEFHVNDMPGVANTDIQFAIESQIKEIRKLSRVDTTYSPVIGDSIITGVNNRDAHGLLFLEPKIEVVSKLDVQ